MILNYDAGQTVEELAHLTRLSRWTIESYLRQYSSDDKTKNDPVKQQLFIEEYKRLKASLGAHDKLCFLDAVHPEYQSQSTCGWIRRGEQKTLQTTGKQKRLHFIGALNLKEMRVEVREYKTIRTEAVLNFFKTLEREQSQGAIHIVLDNASAHKSHAVREYLMGSRIRLHYLPPYSPNLNPIERLWKVFRELMLYNRCFPTCWNFFAEVRSFFGDKVHRLRRVLSRRINDNFQIIQLNPIKLG